METHVLYTYTIEVCIFKILIISNVIVNSTFQFNAKHLVTSSPQSLYSSTNLTTTEDPVTFFSLSKPTDHVTSVVNMSSQYVKRCQVTPITETNKFLLVLGVSHAVCPSPADGSDSGVGEKTNVLFSKK